ncbi:MAG: DUF262 domain-containing protein, partial [Campylobacteraceae bacterium]|nr:DUF262 domain-containing protein [Campylobacteraceae bacterium]
MAVNHTDTENWTIEDIIGALSDIPTKKKKIVIPKFQRTLVWNKKQQKTFIDSIKNGFPVGAVLLYKSSHDNNDNTIYNLIDGLQRSTALNQYIKSPTQFFDEANLPVELIHKIYTELVTIDNEVTKEMLSEEIVKWIVSLIGFDESKGFSSFDLCSHIDELFNLDLDKSKTQILIKLFIPFLKNIKDESNINQFKIPILIYTGDQSNLPLIFERLNSKGTQLSKYQIYAATWITYNNFTISNRLIIDGIKSKYDLLLEEGYEVENYESSPKFYTTQFTTFEYLFGFGKYLCNKFEYLFNSTSKAVQEDSIGFNIMNICLGLQFNEMDKIPLKLKLYDIKEFEDAIINSVEFVFNSLKGHITLKMNKRKKISIVHSELQIVSMIGKVFHSHYNSDLSEKESWSDVKDKLYSNLTYHYLFDILKGYWRGSGDSKAFNLISSEKYENKIKKATWESLFQEWFDEDMLKREKIRINLKDSSILFYKYLYSHSMSAYEEISSINYDIEHIIPVDKLKEISNEIGIPISSFPNLCLLDEKLNRKKGSLTFYQYFD